MMTQLPPIYQVINLDATSSHEAGVPGALSPSFPQGRQTRVESGFSHCPIPIQSNTIGPEPVAVFLPTIVGEVRKINRHFWILDDFLEQLRDGRQPSDENVRSCLLSLEYIQSCSRHVKETIDYHLSPGAYSQSGIMPTRFRNESPLPAVSTKTKPRKRRRIWEHGKGVPSNRRCQKCDCTNTPEWRRGPLGPATLCNACGINWAKSQKKFESEQEQHPASSG